MSFEKDKTNLAGSMESAAQSMSRAKVLLTTASVEDLTYCEAELAAAIESLENLRKSLEALAVPAASGMKEAAQQIHREASEFSELLRQAREFHAGWSGLAESGAAGYNEEGVLARVDRDPSRVALKG